MPDQPSVQQGRYNTKEDHANQDPVSHGVFRSILGQEEKNCNDTTGITETNRPRGANTTLGVTVEIHQNPANDNSTAAKGTHSDEDDTAIFRRKVAFSMVMQHQGDTDNDQCIRCQDEWEPDFGSVGPDSNDKSVGKGRCERWHGMQLGLHGRISQCLDDGRGKVGKGIDGNDNG